MAARQLWIFLTDADVQSLAEMLESREPGLTWSAGRYLRGEPKLLLEDPGSLERRESLPGEQRLYFLHRKHSADVVAHLQPAGPFAGWSQIDEERTDALVLRLPAAPAGEIQPARLYAHTSYWRGGEKIRKRPVFALWANQTLRWLLAQFPSTAAPFIRAGPEALARAKAGELRLTYLYRSIDPAPLPSAPAIEAPPDALTDSSPVED
jgi:hypothetical protein